MPQNEHIELHQKRQGKRLDMEERLRKKKARAPKVISHKAKTLRGRHAHVFQEKVKADKAILNAKIKDFKKSKNKKKEDESDYIKEGSVPAYLMERNETKRSKVLSNSVKQKRKEKGGKWDVPLPSVKQLSEGEMFSVMRSGNRKRKYWKRVINKISFVGDDFTRKPPKYERYIRPSGLRMKKAHVTHPELKTTFCLNIIGVKKNPQGDLFTTLNVITKGAIIEVNTSDLGLTTPSGKVVWGKYAQVMNHPENDGCINAVLLV